MRRGAEGTWRVNAGATRDDSPGRGGYWLQAGSCLAVQGEVRCDALSAFGLVGAGSGAGTNLECVLNWIDEV